MPRARAPIEWRIINIRAMQLPFVRRLAHGPAGIAIAIAVIVLFLHHLEVPLLDQIEWRIYDLRFAARGPVAPNPDVVLAVVDEKSLDALGRWPWSRARMAEVVDALSAAGARVIAFDIGWFEPEGARQDSALARAIARSPADVVLGYFFHDPPAPGAPDTDPGELERALEPISFTALTVRYRGSHPDAMPFAQRGPPEVNLPEISAAAEGAGYFDIEPDDDGVVRRLPLVMGAGADAYPALALEAAWYALGQPPLVVEVVQSGDKNVVTGIQLGDRILPTDAEGRALLSFRGKTGTIPHVSIADILSGAAGNRLRDKIVIAGVTATAVFDVRPTPFGPVYPGAEVQATALDNILGDDFITRPGWADVADQLAIVVLVGLTALLVSRLGAVPGLLAAVTLAAGHIALTTRLFSSRGLLLGVTYPLAALGVTYTVLTVRGYLAEQRERRKITSMFGQYAPPVVIEQMRAYPDQLRLGGEERVLTVLFCDMAGFTTIAERLTPQQTIELLSEHHARMTEQVYACEGMLKEYVGDELMAIFGALVAQPDHAARACRAALAMRIARAEFSLEWQKRGYPPIRSRTGVNSGAMLVGNVGSRYRFSYGVVGDAVNLASRLEGLNKTYGTETLIGEQTAAMAGDAFRLREVDSVRVLGKQLAVRIYELLGEAGETLDPQREKAIGHYAAGLASYRERRFDAALAELEAALALEPGDGPSRTLAERCRAYRTAPPAPDWDGAFQATEK
jgi:adenylate cyclase